MLYFISSNKNKIARAEQFLKPLNVSFQIKELELLEIQSQSIKEIAIHKANQAFAIVKEPLFVSDHGWSITALNGFPGAYMKYMNQWLTSEDFLSLMHKKENREMIFTEYLCFTDGKISKTFHEEIKGHVLYEAKGEAEPWMTVSSFSSDNTSIAEKIKNTPSAFNDSKIFEEFGDWYKTYTSRS
jgi:non-canonical purine NTP pyrophosphatase (RdgB/HAM1 family)